jgi:acyl carrier protein
MEADIKHLVSRIFNIDIESINDKSSPDNIKNWDSLGHMNLVAALEEEFGIELDDDDIEDLRNVALIVNIVQGKLL